MPGISRTDRTWRQPQEPQGGGAWFPIGHKVERVPGRGFTDSLILLPKHGGKPPPRKKR